MSKERAIERATLLLDNYQNNPELKDEFSRFLLKYMRVIDADPKEHSVTFEIEVVREATNVIDVMHGGATMTYIDNCTGIAVFAFQETM